MKKLLIFGFLVMLAVASYGQSNNPNGIYIGKTILSPDPDLAKITKATYTGHDIELWNGATQYNFAVPPGDQALGVLFGDSSTGVLGFKKYATSDDLINAVKDSIRTHRVLSHNVSASHTGNTNETTVFTGTIPALSIGVDGSFHITMLITNTNNANVKTYKIKFNGTVIGTLLGTSATTLKTYTEIVNRHSLSSQVSVTASSSSSMNFGITSGSPTTYTFNTAANITVTITITNVDAGDTASVEYFEIIAVN